MARLPDRLDLTMASGWDVKQKTKPKTKEPENEFQELVFLYSNIVWSQINQRKQKKTLNFSMMSSRITSTVMGSGLILLKWNPLKN